MSNNCLVTKLKSTVDNENLQTLGRISGTAYVASKYVAIAATADNKVLVTLKNATFEPTQGNITYIDSTHAYLKTTGFSINESQASCELTIDNKYLLKNLSMGVLNEGLSALEYCNDLRIFEIGNQDLSNFKYLPKDITTMNLRPNIKGNIEALEDFTSLTSIYCQSNTYVVGDFGKAFGKCTALRNINFTGSAGVTGTIENFVARQRGAGRTATSLNISCGWNIGSVTFQGNIIEGNVDKILTWTATTITFNGVTIDNSDVVNESN